MSTRIGDKTNQSQTTEIVAKRQMEKSSDAIISFTRECFAAARNKKFARKTESDKKSPFEGQAMEPDDKTRIAQKAASSVNDVWALKTVENCARKTKERVLRAP